MAARTLPRLLAGGPLVCLRLPAILDLTPLQVGLVGPGLLPYTLTVFGLLPQGALLGAYGLA